MNFYQTNDVYDFFDLSIILPFYKKLKEFQAVLPKNLKYFQRNGIELVIVLDAPDEEAELISFLDNYPFLNYKVIINRTYHDWRNPAKALNVGIRNAARKYVLVLSPETELFTDVIYQLRYILEYLPNSYAIGNVVFLDMHTTPEEKSLQRYELMPYGSIMVEKKFLFDINGYSEKLESWGGDDDNLRARLDLLGLQKLFVQQAIAIHRERNSKGHNERSKRNATMPVEIYKSIYYPQKLAESGGDWGTEFSEIAYEWKSRKCKKRQFFNYVSNVQRFWIKDESIFEKEYNLIALIQVKNEKRHLPDVLVHLDKYCDGIILLDDSSTDDSYELATSEKLLMKIKIQSSDIFDDLKLRNITLEMAAFVNTEWMFFFDADERFDERFADINSVIVNPDIDSVCFYVIHLWDNELFYKVSLPERADGILPRFRLFRNYGPLKINANRVLHFPATPFKKRRHDAKVLIKHYGNIDPSIRKMKYERYVMQDREGLTQGYTYKYLIEENSKLKDVESINIDSFPTKTNK